jgi:Transposase DDE domain
MIIAPRLPEINGLVGKFSWNTTLGRHLRMIVIGILTHCGRMSAQQASSAITGQSRHRGTVGRFLQSHGPRLARLNRRCSQRLFDQPGQRGRYVFIVDTTNVGHQGEHTENTFSTGNRRRRPAQGRRYSKYRRAARSCQAFVWGLLITPDGRRIPSFRSYRTPKYCQDHNLPHRTQADLAAELIRALPLPAGADLVVLGDTAFESRQLRAACQERACCWIVPANSERVLAGPSPRPKLWALVQQFRPRQFAPLRLDPNRGPYVAMRRRSLSRRGSKTKLRTFYVHQEKRAVKSIGDVRIVFSTKQKPQAGKLPSREETKILLSNAPDLTVAEIVELYLLRWQIELFFKELKSQLGMHQYSFRDFQRVEAWMQMYLFTMLYLEWLRAKRLRSTKVPRTRQWWSQQRTYGLALAVRMQLAEAQLRELHRCTSTPTGTKKLRKKLRDALATEYRIAA